MLPSGPLTAISFCAALAAFSLLLPAAAQTVTDGDKIKRRHDIPPLGYRRGRDAPSLR
jgi:hypothetical protein